MNENIRSRAALLASFYAATRTADNAQVLGQALVLNAASAAGLLLHTHQTVRAALEACARMPAEGPWPLAGRYLAGLAEDETADTERPRAAAGGER